MKFDYFSVIQNRCFPIIPACRNESYLSFSFIGKDTKSPFRRLPEGALIFYGSLAENNFVRYTSSRPDNTHHIGAGDPDRMIDIAESRRSIKVLRR